MRLADEEPDYWLAHMTTNVRDDRRARIIFYLAERGVPYVEPWMDDALAAKLAAVHVEAAQMARYALRGRFAPSAWDMAELTTRFVASSRHMISSEDLGRDWAVIVTRDTPPLERWQCAPRVVDGAYACEQRLPTGQGPHPPNIASGVCWCSRYLLIAGD